MRFESKEEGTELFVMSRAFVRARLTSRVVGVGVTLISQNKIEFRRVPSCTLATPLTLTLLPVDQLALRWIKYRNAMRNSATTV